MVQIYVEHFSEWGCWNVFLLFKFQQVDTKGGQSTLQAHVSKPTKSQASFWEHHSMAPHQENVTS